MIMHFATFDKVHSFLKQCCAVTRAVARSGNPEELVVKGGDIVPTIVEIG